MKRFALLLTLIVACSTALLVNSPDVQARSKATPTPSATPSELPTASPEPPDVAIPRLQAKLKANPNDQGAMTELAGTYLSINRPDLAVQLTQHLLQMGDKTSQVYYIDGYAMLELGRTDAAIADMEQARNLDPSNSTVLGELVDLYLRTQRYSDAEHIANSNAVLSKNDAASITLLGRVYAAEQKYDEARANFEKAAAMDPKDTQPIFDIAQTYSEQNNIPMALQTIARGLAVDPNNVQALVFKATLYARQHDDAHAAPAFDDAVVAAPTDDAKVRILITKASYYVNEKKNKEAEDVFLQGIAQYPHAAALHIAYGDYWASQKNMASAQKEWQAALAIDANYADALQRLGQLAMQQNKPSDAITYFKKLTDVAPDATGYAMLGQAYSFVHDYAHSKDACAKSFDLDRSPQTLGCIAGADFELKNYKEGAQIFDTLDKAAHGFLEANPQLLYAAAKTYQNLNQKQKAIDAYKRLLTMMRKGTKDYADVQKQIALLSKH